MLFKVKPKRYINMANIWIAVFVFAKKVTLVLSDWLFLELISLKAATQISLEIITAEIKPIKKLSRFMLKPVSYTHLRAQRDTERSRMPSSA